MHNISLLPQLQAGTCLTLMVFTETHLLLRPMLENVRGSFSDLPLRKVLFPLARLLYSSVAEQTAVVGLVLECRKRGCWAPKQANTGPAAAGRTAPPFARRKQLLASCQSIQHLLRG